MAWQKPGRSSDHCVVGVPSVAFTPMAHTFLVCRVGVFGLLLLSCFESLSRDQDAPGLSLPCLQHISLRPGPAGIGFLLEFSQVFW